MSTEPMAAEIAELLDQCSPEELSNILATIENEGNGLAALAPNDGNDSAAATLGQEDAGYPGPTAAPVPVPPAAPPPAGSGRRPVPAGVRKGQAASVDGQAEEPKLTMEEIKKLLDEHSAGVISEVRRMLPSGQTEGGEVAIPDQLDITALTQALADRDAEAQALEQKLAALREDLAIKDRRVVELGSELDHTVREVRHRQLDLEFQQLKLEERVRSNAELEKAQRNLAAQVEEASLNARHAAIDADMAVTTPRSIRAQGSLPWTLRNKRLPAVGDTIVTPRY